MGQNKSKVRKENILFENVDSAYAILDMLIDECICFTESPTLANMIVDLNGEDMRISPTRFKTIINDLKDFYLTKTEDFSNIKKSGITNKLPHSETTITINGKTYETDRFSTINIQELCERIEHTYENRLHQIMESLYEINQKIKRGKIILNSLHPNYCPYCKQEEQELEKEILRLRLREIINQEKLKETETVAELLEIRNGLKAIQDTLSIFKVDESVLEKYLTDDNCSKLGLRRII